MQNLTPNLYFSIQTSDWGLCITKCAPVIYYLIFFSNRILREDCLTPAHALDVPELRLSCSYIVNKATFMSILYKKFFVTTRHTTKQLLNTNYIVLRNVIVQKHIRNSLLPVLARVGLPSHTFRQQLQIPIQNFKFVLRSGLLQNPI